MKLFRKIVKKMFCMSCEEFFYLRYELNELNGNKYRFVIKLVIRKGFYFFEIYLIYYLKF